MRVAIIGAGAMGSIYGGYLSRKHEVILVGRHRDAADIINGQGLTLRKNGEDAVFHPQAVTETSKLAPADVVILFVKATASREALEQNKSLIGENTCLMTLQNGSGHEELLREYAPMHHIVIGTTEANGTVLAPGLVRHGGGAGTNIGMLTKDQENWLPRLKEMFDECGFEGRIYDNILQLIWNKLFINATTSVMTGVLKVPQGGLLAPHAWELVEKLLHETVTVAKALGLEADEAFQRKRIRENVEKNPEAVTSICADMRAGRRTEVDTISGSVLKAAQRCGIEVPVTKTIIDLIHAMEECAMEGTIGM